MIHIVDYQAGNITSVQRALTHIGVESVITADPEELLRAEKVIFPGVGQAASAMQVLRERGLDSALRTGFGRGTREDEEFYFVHSYYPQPAAPESVNADCEYGSPFPAVIGRANLIAAQFHPEKSGPAGLRILRNFVEWNGREG